MNTVNGDMTMGEILGIDATIAPILMAAGMHCIGCPSAQGETLEQGALGHGSEVERLGEETKECLAKKEEEFLMRIAD